MSRKLLLVLFFWCGVLHSLIAQKNKIVVTYAADQIKITFFQPDFNHLIADYKFSIAAEKGMPVTDPYHFAGGCRSMQLDSSATNLFFCLYDGNDLKKDTTTPPWTAFYQYSLTAKKYTRLFSTPAESYMVWTFMESRKSLVYYCHKAGALLETSLLTMQTDTLIKLSLSNYNCQLNAYQNKLTFEYSEHDTVKKTEYFFDTKKSITNSFWGFSFFSSYRNGNLLVYDESRTLIHLVTPGKRMTKSITAGQNRFFWKDDTHFYIIEKRSINIYNTEMEMELSYYMEQPQIMEQLSDGLLVKFGKRQFAFVPLQLNTLPDELMNVHDNFIYLISETYGNP